VGGKPGGVYCVPELLYSFTSPDFSDSIFFTVDDGVCSIAFVSDSNTRTAKASRGETACLPDFRGKGNVLVFLATKSGDLEVVVVEWRGGDDVVASPPPLPRLYLRKDDAVRRRAVEELPLPEGNAPESFGDAVAAGEVRAKNCGDPDVANIVGEGEGDDVAVVM
jgi:hypothetical protein